MFGKIFSRFFTIETAVYEPIQLLNNAGYGIIKTTGDKSEAAMGYLYNSFDEAEIECLKLSLQSASLKG